MSREQMASDLEEYLSAHQIPTILKGVLAQLCVHKPQNPVEFIISFLHRNYSGSNTLLGAAPITPAPASARLVKPEPEDETPEEEEDDEEEEDNKEEASAPAPVSSTNQTAEEAAAPMTTPVARPRRRGAISSEPIDDSEIELSNPTIIPKNEDVKARLEKALRENVLFSHLDEDERKAVFDAMFEVNFKPGDSVIQQGDKGDNFYVVDSGECEIYVKKGEGEAPLKVAHVSAGGHFGELALMYNTLRAATVKARTDVRLFAIDRINYRRLLMGQTMRKRKLYESFLEKVPILAQLTKYERLTVADALEPVNFSPGEVIIRQGDPGDAFFIIVEGAARVLQSRNGGPEVEIARLHPSQYFGEIALLTNRPRAATVVAEGPSPLKCVRLDRERFSRVLGPCEDILRRNMETYNLYMATKI